jgi:hypothetical protein
VNTGSGVAFAGDGNVVITGKVGGNVTVRGGSRTTRAQTAGLRPLLADIRSRAAALTPAELPSDDCADALDTLDKALEQALRDPPPAERIAGGLESAREIIAGGHGRAPESAALLARAAQVARTEL